METCSAQLEAAASWASPPFFPSILPSLLSGPATSHSVPLQWLHAPKSRQADGHTLSLALGWKQLLTADSMRTHPCYCICTYKVRRMHTVTRAPQSPLPDAVFCLWPHQRVWTKWLEEIKQCVIEIISQCLDYSEDSSTQISPPSKHFQALYRRWLEELSIIHNVWSNQGSPVTAE